MLLEIPMLGALLFFAILWFAAPGDRKRTEIMLATYIVAMPVLLFAETVLVWTVTQITWLRKVRYDLYAYKFDQWLGSPSFVLGRWVARSRVLSFAAVEIYATPLLVMLAVYTIYFYWAPQEHQAVIRTFFISLFAQLPIYLAFPVCGPRFAFRDFPRQPGPITAHPIVFSGCPNGIPSIHATLAFLCAAFLWRWKAGKVIGSIYVVATLITIMANGEHYALDLICAVPYTWLVWKLGHGWGHRKAAVVSPAVDRDSSSAWSEEIAVSTS